MGAGYRVNMAHIARLIYRGVTRAQNCTGRMAEKVQRKSILRDPDPVGKPNLNQRWESGLFVPYQHHRRWALKALASALAVVLPHLHLLLFAAALYSGLISGILSVLDRQVHLLV